MEILKSKLKPVQRIKTRSMMEGHATQVVRVVAVARKRLVNLR